MALLHKKMIVYADKLKDQFYGDTIAFLVNIITTYTCSSNNFKDGTAFKLVHSCKLMKLKDLERVFESHPGILPQYLHISLTAVVSLHSE